MRLHRRTQTLALPLIRLRAWTRRNSLRMISRKQRTICDTECVSIRIALQLSVKATSVRIIPAPQITQHHNSLDGCLYNPSPRFYEATPLLATTKRIKDRHHGANHQLDRHVHHIVSTATKAPRTIARTNNHQPNSQQSKAPSQATTANARTPPAPVRNGTT